MGLQAVSVEMDFWVCWTLAVEGWDIELTGDEIEHGGHIFRTAIATGFAFHGTEHTVQSLQIPGAQPINAQFIPVPQKKM